MNDRPRISVIIAAYRPGDGFLRVIESLDAQTLPQDEFETIVIDDGSPDDTFEQLQRHAATRPNMTVRRIDNSGWPSRPRNLATEMARGEWVLFMDHDDSLYPDALRRSVEYAAETQADLLSPKESKTSDVWWGMPALEHGNLPNALETAGIDALLPMVPHKVYRREFLLEHGIRFPEGRRMLWEDIYVNVEAWRHARHVAVLADTPVYLWHSSATNNSKTYGPRSSEFWDRLDDLFAFIDRTLDAPGYEDARRSMLLHQYRGRVLGRFTGMLAGATAEETTMALERAHRIQARYLPLEWDALLGLWERARAVLVRDGRTDLLQRLGAIDGTVTSRVEVEEADWVDGRLRLVVRGTFATRGAGPLAFRRDGDRVLRVLPEDIAGALPRDLLDVTDRLDGLKLSVGVRHRADRVTWELPHQPSVTFEPLGEEGLVTAVARSVVEVDLEHAALGAPLSDWVWDTYAAIRWEGLARGTAVKYAGTSRAALIDGRAAVAYRSQSGNLAIDTGGRLRNVVKDSRPAVGDVAGTVRGLVVTLPEVAVTGTTELPATVVFTPLPGGATVELRGTLAGGPAGARLEAAGTVPAGSYRLAFAVGAGEPLPSAFVARVDGDGGLDVVRRPVDPPRGGGIGQVGAVLRRTWRRAVAAARSTARSVRSRR
ncbi:MAG TPA: glycosyltransferase family A protein [Amnibacterium sp.]|nr:glycosyltransferase family A protein [Amnibacterium sp.]